MAINRMIIILTVVLYMSIGMKPRRKKRKKYKVNKAL